MSKKETFRVKRAPTIETEITVPGDKSISHRSIMLAALSNGVCKITNFLEGEDCLATAEAFRQLGVTIEHPEPQTMVVHGSKGVFKQPEGDIYCGNSGTTMRLISGILAAQPFTCRLTGDPSLTKRPMRRVIEPLSRMGAKINAEGPGDTPPLRIEGGPLTPITYNSPVASAQVKSAILLAGMFSKGVTTVIEPALSRDHTERMLEYFQVQLRRDEVRPERNREPKEYKVSLVGLQTIESRDFEVPGDISSAAFWLVAAAAQPGSRLLVKNVGLNPSRTGLLDVLVRMGARIREVVEVVEQGEPSGVIDIKGCSLHGTVIEGAEIPNVIDEIPILAVAAALAKGETVIRDAKELRVKETDRIAAIATNLRAMGVEVTEAPDGMTIKGGSKLKGAKLPSYGDHRIAMAFAIAGLFATGETVIEDVECVATSYPGFDVTLKQIQKGSGLLSRTTPVISSLGR
ncbi:3-phosphoshikimate 1-carboxyvinyltransferase [Terrimicrobium sacchariphilum]|jgi:3-phosphoshikimate 1-carboxyvinyltransferase|uniref:3-phosphoshikimate 1-carboxyvinyltransferase n=1 Tax=Terrimicrobium sacchariphilum TaxID=690879 RepID=A0A146GBL2_TERSA|nr:3-phosphoshikimate 1-carboxyvinyltransferase [Terrimicrobium sacchariphilum]GAT34999.1 3-phosphoshikimate 1-carboxyvinyltransferase [Terrimicrobium sacchariphilum]